MMHTPKRLERATFGHHFECVAMMAQFVREMEEWRVCLAVRNPSTKDERRVILLRLK